MTSDDIKELKKKLEEHETRILELEQLVQSKPKTFKKPLSINELIISKKPKREAQKILSIGYHLEKYVGMGGFSLKDLKEGLNKAKEKTANLSREISVNIKDGFMDEAEKKNGEKTWRLTTRGEQFVENGFKG